MAIARHMATACVMLSAQLTTALLIPPSAKGCSACRLEREFIRDDSWQVPTDLSKVHEVAREGSLTENDAERLLEAVRKTAEARGSFMVTVTDGAMLDLAHNMIRSLDAVPCHAPRLVIGLGSNLCSGFQDDSRTTCVEVFRDTASEDKVAWGSHEYWQVVFRKHVVLTLVAMSQTARYVIYTDPDIAFLDCPVAYLVRTYEHTHDIVFSPNNMLEPEATSVEDVAETYETRGMANITLGPHNRHADINTGLFFMKSSNEVGDLMLKTLRIFKDQEFVHGHYQQFSLVKALDEMPNVRVGVAAGDRLVNGNVFWGHRQFLKPTEVISVHANWMQSSLKIPCMTAAGLFVDAASPRRASAEHWEAGPAARMDAKRSTVVACLGDEADAEEHTETRTEARIETHREMQRPPRPTRPGCYLWLPSGCKEHTFDARHSWRWMENLGDSSQCEVEAKAMYNTWCGTGDAEVLFVAPPAGAPPEPGKAGCYVWLPRGCEKHNFHAQTSWRLVPAEDFPTRDSCVDRAPSRFNRWCDAGDTQALWVPAKPPPPSEPGCYAWLPTGCRDRPERSPDGWARDLWGERHEGAGADRLACERRRATIGGWCGVSNVEMAFVGGR